MSVNTKKYIHDYANRMAPDSQRQMPVFSQVGKGPKGDAFHIELDGHPVEMRGISVNNVTQERTEYWSFPVSSLVPKMHYRVWEGIRVFDGIVMNGYYIEYWCTIETEEEPQQLWGFSTPFMTTSKFYGDYDPASPPDDEIVAEDGIARTEDAYQKYIMHRQDQDTSSGGGGIYIDPIENEIEVED